MSQVMAILSLCEQFIYSAIHGDANLLKLYDDFVHCSYQDKGFEDAKPIIAVLKKKASLQLELQDFAWMVSVFLFNFVVQIFNDYKPSYF